MKKKLLIIVHIYYIKQWDYLSKLLRNLELTPNEYDLFITLSDKFIFFKYTILKDFPSANVVITENIGYDVWPFFKILNAVNLDDYELLLKIHTKRNLGTREILINQKYFFWGFQWKMLLLSIIRSRRNFLKILESFEADNKLGMVSFYQLIDKLKSTETREHYKYCIDTANEILDKLKFLKQDCISYVAGTMFICRAGLFKPLQQLTIKKDDFHEINRNKEDDLPHVLERLFGGIITAQGFYIKDTFSSKLTKIIFELNSFFTRVLCSRYCRKLCRFIFRIKKDDAQKQALIKIFKITVLKIKLK